MPAAEVMGVKATDSKSRNLPSQPRRGVQATLRSVGERTAMGTRPSPTAWARPSPQDRLGLWQVAQEREREPERIGSKSSMRPSSAFAFEKGFSSGNGIPLGRR